MPLGFEVSTPRHRSRVGSAFCLPHALVEWGTRLVVTREGNRRCELAPHQRALAALVYLGNHDTLARIAVGFVSRWAPPTPAPPR